MKLFLGESSAHVEEYCKEQGGRDIVAVMTELFSYTYHRPEDAINEIDWSADGKWIACGTRKGSILVIEAASGKERAFYQFGNVGTTALEWLSDDQHFLTWFENAILICHAWTGEQRVLYHHGSEGNEGSFGAHQRVPDGFLIASSAYEEDGPTVQIHEAETGLRSATFSPREPFDDLQAEHAEAELPVHHPPLLSDQLVSTGKVYCDGAGL